MRGAPATAIQELAGHRDPVMTQRYMRLSPAAIEAAIRLLDRPLAGAGDVDIVESVPCKVSSRSRCKSGLRTCRYT